MSSGRGPKILTPTEAAGSLAARMAKRVDRARQIEVRLGLRPYNVFLVWTKWNADERGEGRETIICRTPLLPTPIVEGLDGVSSQAYSGGKLPVGSVRVRNVSATYSQDVLEGKVIPELGDSIPEPYDFFYEIVEDGRHARAGIAPERQRFNLSATPALDAGEAEWVLSLERASRDMNRDGSPPVEPVAKLDPWRSRQLQRPDDED